MVTKQLSLLDWSSALDVQNTDNNNKQAGSESLSSNLFVRGKAISALM